MLGKCIISIACLAVVMGMPAEVRDIQKLDKATVEDVDINVIHPDVQKINPGQISVATAGVSGTIQPGSTTAVISNSPSTTVRAKQSEFPASIPPTAAAPGGVFARLITDIFQIPITVLQSVTRLLTNPFVAQTKAGGL